MILFVVLGLIIMAITIWVFVRNCITIRQTISRKSYIRDVCKHYLATREFPEKLTYGYGFVYNIDKKRVADPVLSEGEPRVDMVSRLLEGAVLEKTKTVSTTGGGFVRMPFYLQQKKQQEHVIVYAESLDKDHVVIMCTS